MDIPTPTVTYRFDWDGPHYGPACVTVGDNLRAHADHIELAILPDGTMQTNVQGVVMTQKGVRDRRHSYAKLCWDRSVSDEVMKALWAAAFDLKWQPA
jgi:hypothetical protein